MNRPKQRGAAIGDRLSEVLQEDLADIASTMDWIDAGPPPSTAGESAGADAAPAPEAAAPIAIDPTLDLMLDDFAQAVDAMFSVREQVLAAGAVIQSGEAGEVAELGEGLDAGERPATDRQGPC